MADIKSGPGWSDAQWELVGRTVTEAFDKANVAGKFLPCYGPLPERDDYVRSRSSSRPTAMKSRCQGGQHTETVHARGESPALPRAGQ